jgi:tetratricopeptide (TPR) repeat protein
MPSDMRSYRVFISSPGGLDAERQAVRDAIVRFNQEQAIAYGVLFVPVGWELTPGGATRPQGLINEDVRECDYFMLLLCDRWRSKSGDGAAGARRDSEEEYELAEDCLKDRASPMRQVVVFFRPPAPEMLAGMSFQLKTVLDFKRRLENDRDHPSTTFDTVEQLQEDVRRRLGLWLRDHNEQVDRKAEAVGEEVGGPAGAETRGGDSAGSTFGYNLAPDDSQIAPALVRTELISEGKRLADAGRVAAAESCFALAVARGDDPGAFIEYGRFLRRIGRLDQAQEMFERALKFAQQRQEPAVMAAAYSCLGLLMQLRGDLSGAESMMRRSHELAKQRGDERGVSNSYCTIGLIHKARGDLVQAELHLRRSLAIDEKLGRLHGMANQYCNLGLISRRLGDLTKAEEMLRKALEIDEKLGRLEAMANQYGNIGLVLKARGDLDGAEASFRKALAINESLGRLEGLASDYGNLGLICQRRGKLDEAEKMHLTSLSIEEQLGRVEGMARSHHSLGMLAKARGEAAAVKDHWKQARDLFAKIGMPRDVKMMERLLAEPDVPSTAS